MKVLINNGAGYVDYTRYVMDSTLTVEDAINVPTLLNFTLAPTDNSFSIPKRSAYVRVVSEVYASGSFSGYGGGGFGSGGYGGGGFVGGNYGSGKVLATGFITNAPEVEFLGMSPRQKQTGFQQVAYHVNITSDEWLLNCKALPYIPAFVGQTQGAILATLAQALLPGYFDVVTNVTAGDIVPYFQYTPDQTWSDIAKTFGDGSRYRYKVIDKKIYYQPFGDAPLGVVYDETQPQRNFFPLELTTNVVTVPPVNDAIVVGAIEPQANWENYFVGDGFTGNFPLLHNVFDGATALLLEDDWTETGFQTNLWFVNDPLNVFKLQGQGLQVVMGPITGAINTEYVLGVNGVELGGGLNIQHGEFLFTDRCLGGIVGGLYTGAPSGTYIGAVPAGGWPPGVYGSPGPGQQANCVAGFLVTGQASGATLPVSAPQVIPSAVGITTVQFLTTDIADLSNIPPGTIFTLGGFPAGSAFLNGQTVVFQSYSAVVPSQPAQYSVVCTSPNLGGTAYSGPSDTGTAAVLPNTVVLSASGAGGVVLQPCFNGQAVGPRIISQMNHSYLLQTWVGATKLDRYQAIYKTLTSSGQYGGNFLSASGAITWVVTDFDQGVYANTPAYLQNAITPGITRYTLQAQSLPAFAIYAPVNAINLNLVLQPNGTIIAQPPEGSLFVRALTGASLVGLQYATTLVNGGINLINQPPTGNFNFQLPVLPQNLGPEYHYLLGFGQQNQTATIQSSGNSQVLAFYTNTIPGVGARIRHQSWASGQAIARVQDQKAIAAEAVTPGDNGYRTAVMSSLLPLPRTSAECALAAAAAITDREYPQFQGTYTVESVPRKFENLFNPGTNDYPTTGRFFFINSSVRGVSGGIQNFITNTVRIQVVEMREEVLNITIDYGPDTYLEKQLAVFQERTNSTTQNLITPQETAPPPNPIFLPLVGTTFLPNLDNAHIINIQNSAVTGNSVTVDLGSPPITGCEVRRVDTGWGVNNQDRVGIFTTQQFVLSRVLRDQVWYLRQVNGGKVSQFSKALRVVYPFIPSPPSFVSLNASSLTCGYNGYVSDIYGIEVRVPALSGGPYQVSVPFNYNLPNAGTDSIGVFSRSSLAVAFGSTGINLQPNAIALYGPASYTLGLTTGAGGKGVTPQFLSQPRPNLRPVLPGDPGTGGGPSQPNPPVSTPPPSAPVAPPAAGFPSTAPTQFFPGDVVLIVSPNDNSFEGLVVVSQASSGALFGGNWGFGWYDQQPAPRSIGGTNQVVGDAILYRRGPSCPIVGIAAASGTDAYGNVVTTVTLTSSQSVPFSVGDNFIVGCGYNSFGYAASVFQVAVSGAQQPGTGGTWQNPAGVTSTVAYASIVDTQAFGGLGAGQLFANSFGFNTQTDVPGLVVSFNAYNSQGPINGNYQQMLVAAFWPGGPPLGYTIGSVNLTAQPANYTVSTAALRFPITIPAAAINNPAFSIRFTPFPTLGIQPTTYFVNNVQVQLSSSAGTPGLNTKPAPVALFSKRWNFSSTTTLPYTTVPSSQLIQEATLYDQGIVTAVNGNQFSFNVLGLASVATPALTGADGYAAQLPPGTQDGVLFQRPVFSASDMQFDLTLPYVQAMLQIAQALAPQGRAPGLSAYFFNLTWDYSQPLVIPNVAVPSISGLTVDPTTQQLKWNVQYGSPTGFRIEMIDPVTGITQFKTSIGHPHNTQGITQYRLDAADYNNNRIIVVTPFDDQGDGVPSSIFNPAAVGVGGTGGTYSIGCTWNGAIPSLYTLVRIPLDQAITFAQNFGPSQGVLDVAPTNPLVFTIYRQLFGSTLASQFAVGTMTFPAGSTTAAFASATGISFSVGDTIRVVTASGFSGGIDPTAANLGFVLSATKTLV